MQDHLAAAAASLDARAHELTALLADLEAKKSAIEEEIRTHFTELVGVRHSRETVAALQEKADGAPA